MISCLTVAYRDFIPRRALRRHQIDPVSWATTFSTFSTIILRLDSDLTSNPQAQF